MFKIKLEDVGDLDELIIRHDNSGIAAGWLLDSVGEKKLIYRCRYKNDKLIIKYNKFKLF